MVSGLYILFFLLVFPTLAFFYAVVPEIGKPKKPSEFLYGGLTYWRAFTSTVGTVFTASFFLNAIIGGGTLWGGLALNSLLFGVAIVYPIVLYRLITSANVAGFYRALPPEKATRIGFLYFLMQNYRSPARGFIAGAMIAFFVAVLFVETLYLVLWIGFVFHPFFPYTEILSLFLLTICFLYVYIGGYEQVLRTDKLQFFAIVFVLSFSVLYMVFGLDKSGTAGLIQQIFAPSVDTLKAKAEEIDGVIFSHTPDAALIAFGFLGPLLFVGVYFLSSADVWVRLTRLLYVSEAFERDEDLRKSPRLRRFFVLLGVSVFCLFLLPGSLGVYGHYHHDKIQGHFERSGLSSVLDTQSASEQMAEQQATVTWVEDNQTQFWLVSYFIHEFPVEAGLEVQNLVTLVLGNFSSFFLASTLAILSLAVMTTLDTSLISISQLFSDRSMDRHERPIRISTSRSLMVVVFATVTGLAFLVDQLADFETFVTIAQFSGILAGTFTMVILFIIVTRVAAPTWMQRRGASLILAYLSALILSILVWAALWFLSQELGIGIPIFFFEPGIGFVYGKMLVISLICYLLAYLVWGWLDRHAVCEAIDDLFAGKPGR